MRTSFMEANIDAFLHQFQHLNLQLEEIISATNNFHDQNCIGGGGFGKVYKGQVSHSKGQSTVAIKRLDRKYGQGTPEFLKEITMLSRYRHENLISLLGFCYQGDEMILVYEHASHGSLDRQLNSCDLTWIQRLKICIDAGKGLSYLHDPKETHQRLIHCDMKSGNILLDDHWNAKVSDFGLSIIGPANDQYSVIITFAAGTLGYCDPQYAMTHTLTKESDVYSFGVVLFEVLCGTLCCTYHFNGDVQKNLVPTWIKSYEEKKLSDIIFKSPTIEPLEQSALEIFSDIAYRCLKDSRDDRPDMTEVVAELETALESQELQENQEFKGEWNKQRSFYEKISKTAEPPVNFRSEIELMKLFSKGVLLNGGKTWFSLNKKGEHCEMISFAECLGSEFRYSYTSDKYNSRFSKGTHRLYSIKRVQAHVKTKFLSPGITYTVNLVFKMSQTLHGLRELTSYPVNLKYKLPGETESSIAYLAYKREDEWWMCELYQFTSDRQIVDFQILFECHDQEIEAEGIEFWPLEKVDEKQRISYSDSDAKWNGKLPADYENIMKRSRNSLQWTTKKEAYSIMSRGFLINDDKMPRGNWFSLDKNGKKCFMLSAADICGQYRGGLPLTESRFGEAYQCDSGTVEFRNEVPSHLVSSSQTIYAIYLVYKLPKDLFEFKAPVRAKDYNNLGSGDNRQYIYLTVPPQTPVLKPKAGQNTHNPPSKIIKKSLPQQRKDGWMEVQLLEFRPINIIHIRLTLEAGNYDRKGDLTGLIIEGIEFRPI